MFLLDTWILKHVMKILNVIYKNEVTHLIASCVTRWRSDKFSRGSYSFVAPGSSGQDYDEISRPIIGGSIDYGTGQHTTKKNAKSKKSSSSSRSRSNKPNHLRVFFAGEATNRFFPATAHGAFLSGVREAQLLHRHYHHGGALTNEDMFNTEGPDGVPSLKCQRERIYVKRTFSVRPLTANVLKTLPPTDVPWVEPSTVPQEGGRSGEREKRKFRKNKEEGNDDEDNQFNSIVKRMPLPRKCNAVGGGGKGGGSSSSSGRRNGKE